MERRKIAIFGGSFNPVHVGHMIVAQYVAEFTDADEVWMLVSPRNPLKAGTVMARDEARFELVRIACEETPGVVPSDFEFSLPQPSYTYITLQKLAETYPDKEFRLLIGADNWLVFDKWKNSDEILANHEIMIYPRPGYDMNPNNLPKGVRYLSECPVCSLSSTLVREAIKSGRCVSHFVPKGVYNYIMNNKLY